MTKKALINQVMNPRNANLGNVGVALVKAVAKA